jgi:hypothetical protein
VLKQNDWSDSLVHTEITEWFLAIKMAVLVIPKKDAGSLSLCTTSRYCIFIQP